MPVLKHAKKKLRQDKKRTLANKKKRSTYKELIKKAKASPSKDAVSSAFKAIDKAAKANLMHENKAGRLKSSLSKVLNGNTKTTPATSSTKKAAPKAKTPTKKSPAKPFKKSSATSTK